MSGVPPNPFFFKQPLRYLYWASIHKPAYFYSILVGLTGPVLVVTVPPIRRYMGEEQIPKIPMTYPSKCLDIERVGLGKGRVLGEGVARIELGSAEMSVEMQEGL